MTERKRGQGLEVGVHILTDQARFYPVDTKMFGSEIFRVKDLIFSISEGTINTDPLGHLPTLSDIFRIHKWATRKFLPWQQLQLAKNSKKAQMDFSFCTLYLYLISWRELWDTISE